MQMTPSPATDLTPPAVPATPPIAGRSTLSCVVPCWNEAANLPLLLAGLESTLTALQTQGLTAWEVLVVDDGSTDGSALVAARWAQRPGFRFVQLSRNFGKEAALTAGLQAARGDAVVLLDADLQHPPEIIPQLVAHWQRGMDVAYTVREHRQDESALKRWGARAFYRLVNAADRFELPAGAGDFRLMDRAVVDALLSLPERNRFLKGLYAWVGFPSVAVPYMPSDRATGRSSFNLRRLMSLALDGLTGFTTWPLRAVSLVGTLLALVGFGYGAWLSVDYLVEGHPISGWTTIVVGLLFFSGVQLLSLGVVGEYVGRIFEEVKARPLYIVQRDLGQGLPARPAKP